MVNRDSFAAVRDRLTGMTAAALRHALKCPDQPVKSKPSGVFILRGIAGFFFCGFLRRFCAGLALNLMPLIKPAVSLSPSPQ